MLASKFFELAGIDFPGAFESDEPYFVFAPEIGQAIETCREPDGVHVIAYDTGSRETLVWLIVDGERLELKERLGVARLSCTEEGFIEIAQQLKTIVANGCERE